MTYYDKSDLNKHFTMHFDVLLHGAFLQMLSSCLDLIKHTFFQTVSARKYCKNI